MPRSLRGAQRRNPHRSVRAQLVRDCRVADLLTHFTSFGGKRVIKAVDGISFTVNEGETLGLIGESGCGKTTTCLSIVGLLPSNARIAGGSIAFRGEEL